MLQKDAIESAIPLTQRFDQSKLRLVPVAGSPLEMLCADSEPPAVVASATDGLGFDFYLSALPQLSSTTIAGQEASQHDISLERAAEICIPAVASHISHARNIVRPEVEDLVTRVTEELANETVAGILNMEIVEEGLPAVLSMSAMQTMISKYAGAPFMNFSMNANFPAKTAEEIIEMLMTGVGSVDSEIRVWAASLGKSFFIELWNAGFHVELSAPGDSQTIQDYTNTPDKTLAVFLLARSLYNDIPEGTEMSLSSVHEMMTDYAAQTATKLDGLMSIAERDDKNGLILRSIQGGKITVRSNVYAKWIEQGGDSDAIFGNALREVPFYTVDGINENIAELREAWRHKAEMIRAAEKINRIRRIRQSMNMQYRRMLIDAHQEDPSKAASVTTMCTKLEELIYSLRDTECSNLYDMALRVVCEVRYPHTEAFKILNNISVIKTASPELDIRECVTLSVARYVIGWVNSQTKVIPV